METTTENSTLQEMKGAFAESLLRNNKKIRQDRAIAILEDAEMVYKREIEDFNTILKRIKRDRASILDLSPSTADSLVVASDFNARDFVTKDIAMGIEIRNIEIKLEVANARYEYLFGKKVA